MPLGRMPQAITSKSMPLGRLPQAITNWSMPLGRMPQAITSKSMPLGRLPQAITSWSMPLGRLPLSTWQPRQDQALEMNENQSLPLGRMPLSSLPTHLVDWIHFSKVPIRSFPGLLGHRLKSRSACLLMVALVWPFFTGPLAKLHI